MNVSSGASAQMINHAMMNMRSTPGINLDNLSGDDAALLAAAKEFEAYFLQMMFRAMRDTVDSDRGILPESESTRIFQDMLDEHNARSAAFGGGMGLARQIFNQMTAYRNNIREAVLSPEAAYNGAYGNSEE